MTEKQPKNWTEAMEILTKQAAEFEKHLQSARPAEKDDKFEVAAMQLVRAVSYFGEEIPHYRKDLENRGILTAANCFIYAAAVLEAPGPFENSILADQKVRKFAKSIRF
jgi:hypothetical protein